MDITFVKALFDGLKFMNQPEPCTPDQVQALEKQLGVTFSKSYKDFLLWMGQSRCGILIADSWLTDDLPDLKQKAIKMLETNNFPKKLPPDAFVFWMSQGYIFAFTLLSAGDNSPVFRYHSTLDTTDF